MRRAGRKLTSLRNFALFADACRYGSFTQVGKRNYMMVQNVSKAISDMEREVGLRLFDRTYHGVAPTAAGRALLPFAEAILRGAAAWEAEAELIRRAPATGPGRARAAGDAPGSPTPGRAGEDARDGGKENR